MNLLITSTDSFGEEFSKQYKAQIEENIKGKKYSYLDDKTNVAVYIFDNKIKIIRRGEINSTLVLNKVKETIFSYNAPYLRKNFKVLTKKIEILEKELHLRYSIYDEKDIVNEIEIKIKEIKN